MGDFMRLESPTQAFPAAELFIFIGVIMSYIGLALYL